MLFFKKKKIIGYDLQKIWINLIKSGWYKERFKKTYGKFRNEKNKKGVQCKLIILEDQVVLELSESLWGIIFRFSCIWTSSIGFFETLNYNEVIKVNHSKHYIL